MSKNPCAGIKSIQYEVQPREPLSDIQMETVRSCCISLREKAIIETLYSTGCRVSELARLKKEDIDFNTREVHLFGKGKKHRTSYLNARAEVALRDYLEKREGDSEYVFISMKKPYSNIKKASVERIVKNIGERSKIKLYPHRIRHTTATDALDHGMPITELQAMLGHESTDTTMIYAKIQKSNVQHDHHRCII